MEKISEKLPKAFLEKMKKQLGSNFDAFVSSFDEEAVRGIRVNTKRISVDDFVKNFEEKLEPISYAKDGFVFESDEKIGTSAKHLSGLCYLQEPASMLAVCSSGIENENRPLKVLDLCASPGGKTSQIASRISEDSILFSNEIIKSRADVLFSNVERQGFSNVVVLNEEPKRLLNFEGFFDYVFVDAPCSGEGMFRKNPETISEWSESNVKMCAERQREILEIAEKLVAAGGKLVYSTCTYSEEEDEEIVEWFLENFNFKLVDVPKEIKKQTLSSKANVQDAEFARKHFSFAGKGEGQFVAVFENLDESRSNALYSKKHYRAVNQIGRVHRELVDAFSKDALLQNFEWKRLLEVGVNVFLAPVAFDSKMQTAVDELRFVSIGVKVGSTQKDRFEPNHNLFMAKADSFKRKVELSDDELKKYLHGEELARNDVANGYAVVVKDGYPIGGTKVSNGKLKNLYPKGMRV